MPVQFTIPPDTRANGSGNPPVDMNGVVDTVTALGATFSVLNAAFAGGADPTGVADSSPAFAAAIAALPAAGGTITTGPGVFRLNSAVTAAVAPTQTIRITGAGLNATILMSYVTGDAIRMYGTSYSGGWCQGSGVENLTIDLTNAGAGSNGLHIGDINAARVNIQVKNATGVGSAGIFFENTTTWTEQPDIRAILNNCTQGVVFSKSGAGTNSFGYGNYDFTVWTQTANQDGIVFQSAVTVYHGKLTLRGNFQSSSSAVTSAVLRFTGSSHLTGMNLNVQVEAPAGTNRPTTIIMDATSAITGCYGILDFSGGGGIFTPTTTGAGQVLFTGIITGDVNLNPGAAYSVYICASASTPQVLCSPYGASSGYHGSGFPTAIGDVFTVTLGANLTANLTSTFYNGTKTLGVAQRAIIIIKQAASGGPYTVTWPVSGTPSVSTPTILWTGGSVPVMSAAANAVDIYEMETPDGITWYGTARQAQASSGGPPGGMQNYLGMFGTGTDGAATLDGTVTPAWTSKAGNVYTQLRDAHLTSLTINAGVTLKGQSFRVFCQGTVTIASTGIWSNTGGNAAGSSAGGGAGGSASFPGGRSGGAGGTGVSGAGGIGAGGPFGNAGGIGGAGTSGAGGAATVPAVSSANATANVLPTPYAALTGIGAYGFTALELAAGSGGGGGGSDAASNAGGGGGGGGGTIAIFAWAVVNNGSITVAGGNGAAGAAGNAGGGGGGAGGLLLMYMLTALTGTGTTAVTGGTHGNGVGTGANGADGGAGALVTTVVQ